MRRVETEGGGSRLSLKLKPELHSLTAGEEKETSDLHFHFFFWICQTKEEAGGGGKKYGYRKLANSMNKKLKFGVRRGSR